MYHKRKNWLIALIVACALLFSMMGTAAAAEVDEEAPLAVARAAYPTYEEAYDIMMRLQDQYPEGLRWTNFEPYGSLGKQENYRFKGGAIKGAEYGVGCAAFCFILSDAVFGTVPCRVIDAGNFDYEDLHVGDFLRMGGHFVTILKMTPNAIIVAEGNYNKSVHWGRSIGRNEVMQATSFVVTRYPEGYEEPNEGTEVDHGTEGTLNWTLSGNHVLTISGTGAMGAYDYQNRPSWEVYKDQIYSVVVEDGITAIGDRAFYQMTNMLEVSLPSSVATIGIEAFGQSGLVAAILPSGVKTIGNDAFRGCGSMASVTIPEGVETVGERAFYGCTSLKFVEFPSTLKLLGGGAFTSCEKLNQVVFVPSKAPGALTIGSGAFMQCWNLNFISLPEGLTVIPPGSFMSCTIYYLYIPSTMTSLAEAGADDPFNSSSVAVIYFGGTEAQWNTLIGKVPSACASTTRIIQSVTDNSRVFFDQKDPFAPEPAEDPGDIQFPCENGHVGVDDGEGNCTVCGDPISSEPAPVEPGGDDDKHSHSWATTWSSDDECHWHECAASGCDATTNGSKDGYAAHIYSEWVVDLEATATEKGSKHRTCEVCSHEEIAEIAATGGGSSSENPGGNTENPGGNTENPGGNTENPGTNSGGSDTPSNPSGPSNPSNPNVPTTPSNPGSSGGTSTPSKPSTPTKPASSTVTAIDPQTGTQTTTMENPDGSKVVTVTQKDGTVATTNTSASGAVNVTVNLSVTIIQNNTQNGTPVTLPMAAVEATRDVATAPTIVVSLPSEMSTKITIPTVSTNLGTVAVIVKPDGATSVVKTSTLSDDGVTMNAVDGATVKIIDNSKSFSDVSVGIWSESAITFATARELFAGTSATTFAPDAPMTRGMLMTVLARLDGAEVGDGEPWYAKGTEWAIVNGISDGASPNEDITREQLVTMLWRYAHPEANVSSSAKQLASFADAGQISNYAQEAMLWAVQNGIVSGFGDGRLGPQHQATRAQVAQILMNFINRVDLVAKVK